MNLIFVSVPDLTDNVNSPFIIYSEFLYTRISNGEIGAIEGAVSSFEIVKENC